jgi:hypothetical protein
MIFMTLTLIKKKDVVQNYGEWRRHTRYKKCFKCGTEKINLDLTELINRNGRLRKSFLCDRCDQIKE